jgi:CRP/FNR family transcriptional regulator, cyclic AMP receptor protein
MTPFSELKNFPLFATLQTATIKNIAQRTFKLERRTGETLVIEGMPAEFCYFLVSGHVRVVRMNTDGRVQVLARLRPGSPLNIISLLVHEKTNQASIETLTLITAYVLHASDFNQLLADCPDFSTMLLRTFAERMKNMTKLAAQLSLYTVQTRLARFLIELAELPQSTESWTQDEIAAQIGTVRDVVGRLLRKFESEGLIKRSRQQIILLDRDALSLISKGHDQT